MELIFEQDPSIVDDLWVRVIAQKLLQFSKAIEGEDVARGVDSEAVRVLSEIKRVLDNPDLDDLDCSRRIEAIVDAFYRTGLFTTRHLEYK